MGCWIGVKHDFRLWFHCGRDVVYFCHVNDGDEPAIYSEVRDILLKMWRSPKMVVPPNHQFLITFVIGFSMIHQTFLRDPLVMETIPRWREFNPKNR